MILRAGLLAGLAVASVARADAPRPAHALAASPARLAAQPASLAPASSEPADPAVAEAADANLESTASRNGLTFAASIGGGLIIGFGIDDSVGRGGAVSLRLGHVATPRTVITFELGVTGALHRPPTKDAATEANTDANLLAGAQYYVNRSLWLRAAGGLGIYQGRGVTQSTGVFGDVTLLGPAVLGGIGFEIARFKWAALGLELATSAMVNGDGVLVASDLNLGLSFD